MNHHKYLYESDLPMRATCLVAVAPLDNQMSDNCLDTLVDEWLPKHLLTLVLGCDQFYGIQKKIEQSGKSCFINSQIIIFSIIKLDDFKLFVHVC